jgi:hypothetical protein
MLYLYPSVGLSAEFVSGDTVCGLVSGFGSLSTVSGDRSSVGLVGDFGIASAIGAESAGGGVMIGSCGAVNVASSPACTEIVPGIDPSSAVCTGSAGGVMIGSCGAITGCAVAWVGIGSTGDTCGAD